MEVNGQIEREFLYATALARDLLPFALRRAALIVLPIQTSREGKLTMVSADLALAGGFVHAHDWLAKAERIWEAHRKEGNERTLREWVNYDDKLISQSLRKAFVVLYNQSGTNLAAALVTRTDIRHMTGVATNGFVVDSKCYWYATDDEGEASYLVGVLNSSVVNIAIKRFQTKGLQGERDIHRRPFEACAIPMYDRSNPLHERISRLAAASRTQLLKIAPKMEGSAAVVRAEARRLVAAELTRIDTEVTALLPAAGQETRKAKRPKSPGLFHDKGPRDDDAT
jgi:hypothetical protein